jgi:FlaG/FlaF family flagellin (archaellin)
MLVVVAVVAVTVVVAAAVATLEAGATSLQSSRNKDPTTS